MNFTGASRRTGFIAGVLLVFPVASNVAIQPELLSVLATLGLMYFTPIVERYMQWIPEKFGLREIACATIGTQIAVLPLLLYSTGHVSLVSVPANLLALVPTPLAMLFACVAALGGAVSGSFAPVIGFPAYILLSYVIFVAKIFAALPLSAVEVPPFSALWLYGVYGALALVVFRAHKKQNPA